jgi:hypothetical protein
VHGSALARSIKDSIYTLGHKAQDITCNRDAGRSKRLVQCLPKLRTPFEVLVEIGLVLEGIYMVSNHESFGWAVVAVGGGFVLIDGFHLVLQARQRKHEPQA